MRYEIVVGLRYLARRDRSFLGLITAITVGGVAVGAAALIVVLAVLTGFERALLAQILSVESDVEISGTRGPLDVALAERVADVALEHPDVRAATPFVTGQALLIGGARPTGVLLRAVDPARARAPGFERLEPEGPGHAFDLLADRGREAPGIVLGSALAASLGVWVGDRLPLASPAGVTLTPFALGPAIETVEVAGIVEVGPHAPHALVVHAHVADGRRFLGLGDHVSGVAVRADDPADAREIRTWLEGRLGPSLRVRDWEQRNGPILDALRLERIVFFVVVLMITLVATFNIVSTLVMTVLQKTRDVAILEAMGATPASIQRIFVVQGLAIGLGGAVLGGIAGLGVVSILDPAARWLERATGRTIVPSIFNVEGVPTVLHAPDVVLVLASALALSFLATLHPARRAASIDPAVALRSA